MNIKLKETDYPGKLIVFCGVDGSGKSTMIKMLVDRLREKQGEESFLLTMQPRPHVRNMDIFKKMMYTANPNVDYRALLLLTLSERVQHCHEEIVPALKEGKTVISDRYIFTSIANMLARGYENEAWFSDVIRHIPKPDHAYLANVPPELAIERILSREAEKDRYLDKELLHRVSGRFLEIKDQADFTLLNTAGSAETAFRKIEEELAELIC